MSTVAEYTLPIYEAVVCNLAIEKVQRDETEEKLLTAIFRSLALSKEVLHQLIESDFSTTPPEIISPVHIALCVLVSTGRQAVEGIHKLLQDVSEEYRRAIAKALEDFESNTDRLEEIAEGWGITFDESMMHEIKQALAASRKSGAGEIQDWRKMLASISD
jgi:t-SNARE complex subunit (syntaxin)